MSQESHEYDLGRAEEGESDVESRKQRTIEKIRDEAGGGSRRRSFSEDPIDNRKVNKPR